jgi:hypothetical protein
MTFKENIHTQFTALTNTKIATLQSTLDDLTIASQNESKSTAGDKHETALAMLQIEQVQVQNQLDDFLIQKNILDRLDITLVNETIIPGSLITTNKGCFYLSVAAGKIIIDDIKIFAMSTNSPLGSKMLGAKVGDNITQNEFVYIIESFE